MVFDLRNPESVAEIKRLRRIETYSVSYLATRFPCPRSSKIRRTLKPTTDPGGLTSTSLLEGYKDNYRTQAKLTLWVS
jgi:hypothetical protein